MKKYSVLLGVALCVCCGCERTTRVSGTLRCCDKVSYRYFNLSDSMRETEKVTVSAPGGKFSFELPDADAVYAVEVNTYSSEEMTLPRSFVFDVYPGEAVEVVDSGKLRAVSPTHIRMEEMQRTLDSCPDRQEARGRVLDYIEAHPKDPLSAYLIKKQVPDSDAVYAYGLLDASLRGGKIGAYLSAVVKDKQDAERSRKARLAEIPRWEAAEKLYAEAEKKRLEAGDPFPALVFTGIDGKEFTMDRLRGRYAYIEVWATTCIPCRKELACIKELEKSLRGKDIAFVGVSVDINPVAWEKVVEEEGLEGVQLYAGGAKGAFKKFFGYSTIPHFILLDKEGRVLDTDMSRPSNPETEKALLALEGI